MLGSDWLWVFAIPLVVWYVAEKVGWVDILDDESFLETYVLPAVSLGWGAYLIAPYLAHIPYIEKVWAIIGWVWPEADVFTPLLKPPIVVDWYVAPYAGFGAP
jgi:hypothetical protein